MNAATATDFAFDLGFGIKRFIRFEGEALDRLVEAAAIDAQSLENLISWTGRPVGDAWTEFRGERYPSKAVRNPVMRGCPMCLREDASANPQNPSNVMVMRGDWLLRDVTICCRHHHPIVPLWQCSSAAERFDIGVHLHDLAPAIIVGDLDQPLRQPSPYDLWLDERLENGKDATWLANHSLFVATTMCQLLGTCLIQQSSDGGSDPALAQAAGFAVLSQGETELRRALKSLAAAVNSNWISITRTYGKLYQALDDYLTDDGFGLFRNILRECILETWPVAAGEVILGQALPSRLLHTTYSAAKETGISRKLLETCLIDIGALPQADLRPPPLRTFSAIKYDAFLKELPALVGVPEMRAAIGATIPQFRSLCDDNLLQPAIRNPKVKATWRVPDGLAFLAELAILATPLDSPSMDWESIQMASKRSSLSVGDLIAAIRTKKLQLGGDTDLAGYRSYMVLKSEVDRMAGEQPHRRRRAATIPSGEIASSYAMKIGIKAKQWFLRLYVAGHTSARWVPHPVTGADILYLTDEDIAAFHRRFMTPATMQAEFGMSWQKCMAQLRNAGVAPFTTNGQAFGPLYERRYVEPILRPDNT